MLFAQNYFIGFDFLHVKNLCCLVFYAEFNYFYQNILSNLIILQRYFIFAALDDDLFQEKRPNFKMTLKKYDMPLN